MSGIKMKFCILVVAMVASYGYSTEMTNQEKRALARSVLKGILVDNKDQIENYIRRMVKDILTENSDQVNHADMELRNILKIETESEAKKLYDQSKPELDLGIDSASQEKKLLGNEIGLDSSELEDDNIKKIVNLLDNVPKWLVDQYYKEKALLEDQQSLPDLFSDLKQQSKVSKKNKTSKDENEVIDLENIDDDETKNGTKAHDNNQTDVDIESLLNESIKRELKDKVKAKISEKFKDAFLDSYLEKKDDLKNKLAAKLKNIFRKKIKK